MGLFDDVRCEYPLPGNPPSGIVFQTKDLACCMTTYTVTPDGKLLHSTGEEYDPALTTTIFLRWNNLVASGPGTYTSDGEDALFLEYEVLFVDGRVFRVRQTRNDRQLAAKSKPPARRMCTTEELHQIKERKAECLIGRSMWVRWGSSNPQYEGYPVKVIAENEHELVVENPAKRLEIIGRHNRDTTLFDSREDAKRHEEERRADWKRRQEEFDAEIASKSA